MLSYTFVFSGIHHVLHMKGFAFMLYFKRFKSAIYRAQKSPLFFTIFLVLYEFLTYIANDMLMPAMVSVVHTFGGHTSNIATSLTAYILGGASLQLLLGPLSDRLGRRPVMLWGVGLFIFFTACLASAQSIAQFLIARFFQGMGLCFISVVGYTTIQEILSEMEAVRLISIMTNVASLAPLLGPLAGAIFISYFNWRSMLALIGCLAVIALWGLWRFMPESVSKVEYKESAVLPLLNSAIKGYLKLVVTPSFFLGTLIQGICTTPIIIWIALSPVILIEMQNLTVMQYSFWQLPIFGAGLLGSLMLRKLSFNYDLNKLILIGSLICCLGLSICFIMALMFKNPLSLIIGFMIYAWGLGINIAPLNRKILFSTTVSKGLTSALLSLMSMMLQAILLEVANILFDSLNIILLGGFCALLGVVTLIICFFFLKPYPPTAYS